MDNFVSARGEKNIQLLQLLTLNNRLLKNILMAVINWFSGIKLAYLQRAYLLKINYSGLNSFPEYYLPVSQRFICTQKSSMVVQMVKNLPAMQEIWVPSLVLEDYLERSMATHSSILAWRITWTEETSGIQSMGSQSQT